METKTIEQIVKELVINITEDCIDFGSREVFVGRMNGYITNALTEQDRIARTEQREIDIQRACDVYCKVCGHFAHTTPTQICRHDCPYYSDFEQAMKGE